MHMENYSAHPTRNAVWRALAQYTQALTLAAGLLSVAHVAAKHGGPY